MQPICSKALRGAEEMLVASLTVGTREVKMGLVQLTPLRTCNQTNAGLACAAICTHAVEMVSEIACEVCANSQGCERDQHIDKSACFEARKI